MTELANEYGTGLWELAAEEHLTDDLLEQLSTLKQCFAEDPDYLRLLSNRALGKDERLSLLDEAFSGRVHPYLLSFLKLLCERGALSEFAGCEAVYREHYNEFNGIQVAVVTSSRPLKADQLTRLQHRLEEISGHRVELKEKTDPQVLGGLLVEMDGKRYDNTVRSRLGDISRMLTGA